MSDPVYIYRKGLGWLPRPLSPILSDEDAMAPWIKLPGSDRLYPAACEGWKILPNVKKANLQVGDVCVFTTSIKQCIRIENGRPVAFRIYDPARNTTKNRAREESFNGYSYCYVARPPSNLII